MFDMEPYAFYPKRSFLFKYDKYLNPIWMKSIEGFISGADENFTTVESINYCAVSFEY